MLYLKFKSPSVARFPARSDGARLCTNVKPKNVGDVRDKPMPWSGINTRLTDSRSDGSFTESAAESVARAW